MHYTWMWTLKEDKFIVSADKIDQKDNYELIRLKIEHIIINPDQRVYLILDSEDKQSLIELNSFEASMLSFVYKGLHKNSHIQIIHQLYLNFMKIHSTNLEQVVIESKVGDVIYSTLKLCDKKFNRTFTVTSLVDGIILSVITECPLFIVKKVWDDMDEVDEWDYENYIVDYEDDEDED